jgi:hypothetical protein
MYDHDTDSERIFVDIYIKPIAEAVAIHHRCRDGQ